MDPSLPSTFADQVAIVEHSQQANEEEAQQEVQEPFEVHAFQEGEGKTC